MTSRPIWYVAHPLRPTDEEVDAARARIGVIAKNLLIIEGGHEAVRRRALAMATAANIASASRWLRWLSRSYSEIVFIAPWLAAARAGASVGDPTERAAMRADSIAAIRICAGVVLCGGRIGAGGEDDRAAASRLVDLMHLGAEPPADGTVLVDEWLAASRDRARIG